MPIRDQAAMERSLANDYGPNRAADAPVEFDLLLYTDDPAAGGVELSATTDIDDGAGGTTAVPNGYAPGYLHNDDWAAPSGGEMVAAAPVPVGAPTEAWQDAGWWQLRDRATGQLWDGAPLSEALVVTGAGDPPTVLPVVFYANNLDEF